MSKSIRIAIVSPFPPPYGGMAIQAEKLVALLRKSGVQVIPVRTNSEFPVNIKLLRKIKGIRTLINIVLFLNNLHRTLPHVDTIYFLTGFFNFFFWITYPALLLIRIHRKKVILSAHGGAAGLFFKKYGFLIWPILRTVKTFTTPSGFLRDAFWKAFNVETKLIPNIADLDRFHFRERIYLRPRLLVTRSLEKIYDVQCVINAFKLVQARFPDSMLGIAGDGSERKYLEKLVSRLNLSSCVKFYGLIEHATIHELYDHYDILVNASHVDNQPLVIIEAFASGLPVVSTRAGGIPYMLEDGVTGLLVEVGDCEALAKKVIELVENPELSLSLARKARAKSHEYSWQHVKNLLLPLFAS